MRIRLNYKNLRNSSDLEEFVNKRIERLGEHLQEVHEDLLHLHGTLEKNPHRDEFYSIFSLYLPHTVFHCRAKANDIFSTINFGFDKLIAQIEKRRSRFKSRKKRG